MDGDITAADVETAFSAAEAAAPAVETPAVTSDAPAQPDAATIPPAGAQSAAPDTARPQEPPQEKWPVILENARQKALRDVLGDMQPEQAREILQGIAQHRADPLGFFEAQAAQMTPDQAIALLERISNTVRQRHPDAIRSFVGRKLGEHRGRQEPQLETIPVEMPDGRTVQLVTADSMAKREAWVRADVARQQQEALQPILTEREQRQKDERERQAAEETRQWAGETWTDLLSWQGMDAEANRIELGQWLQAHGGLRPDLPRDQFALLINRGYREIVLPKITAMQRSKVAHDINRAAAAGSVNPGRTSTQAPKSVDEMSLREAIEAEYARLGGG